MERLIRRVVESGHHSVLEHVSATFRMTGVSRAMTHQLVRHRLCSFTQQSQRYVDEKKFGFVEPESIRKSPAAHELFQRAMDEAREAYRRLQELGVRNEDARFVLPNAVESQIVVTANLREWRHIVELRCRPGSQWEIRRACGEVLRLLKQHVPTAFEDLRLDEGGTLATPMGDD